MPEDGKNQPKAAANSVQTMWQDAFQSEESHGLWCAGGAQIVKIGFANSIRRFFRQRAKDQFVLLSAPQSGENSGL
jgi:hypothetical protein